MQINSLSIKNSIDYLALGLVFLAILTLPFSPALSSAAIIAAILNLISGKFKQNIHKIFNYKMQYISLLLVTMLAIGITYNHFNLNYAIKIFMKYSDKLLLPPLLVASFNTAKLRQIALNCFIIGVFCSSFLFTSQAHITHYDPIAWSMLIAFACFLLVHKIINNRKFWLHILYGVIFLWLVFDLYFINIERTGMLIFFVLMALTLIQKLKWKGVLYAIIIIPMIFASICFLSPKACDRIMQIKRSIHELYYSHNQKTSTGTRIIFLKTSLGLIKRKPLFGYGTGSFPYIYDTTHAVTAEEGQPLWDPHNSFVHLAVQIGLVGMIIFMLWLITQFFEARSLPLFERYLAQGLIITFTINSCTVDALLIHRSALFYVLFISVLFGAGIEKQTNL
ncbi:MAG: O-antigen ligase family protein [Gammaproteobacteria bacterium]|jgi:O-antigen ligase